MDDRPPKHVEAKSAYHHGDLRAQLVEAVRQLVEAKGPDGFSISEASRAAGVSTAAPYKHFRDKPDILRAVAMDGMHRLDAQMRDAIAAFPPGTKEQVVALGRTYIDFARREPGVFQVIFGRGAEDDAEMEALGAECFGIVVETVKSCIGPDYAEADAQQRAYMLWTLVHGHSFLTIDRKTAKPGLEIDEQDYLTEVAIRVLRD